MDEEFISYLLDGVKEDAPGLVQAIETYGHLTLSEYSSVFNTFTNTTVQSMSDFLEICQSYATRLLGEKTGINLAAHLKFCPVILTANHHGVEYISHAGQGSMIYALSIFFKRKQGIKGSNIVPIFSCGTIPLNNQSYPRGILLSRKVIKNYKTKGTLEKPVGITVFPNRLVKTVVNIAPPFTTTMVKSAIAKAANLYEKGIIHHKEIKTVTSVLSKDYLSDKILALKTYSDQAALLSHNLWKNLFSENMGADRPDMIFLEMERIATELIQKDVYDSESLLYKILFDDALFNASLNFLNGIYGCWDKDRLDDVMNPEIKGGDRDRLLAGSGTCFFWGINTKGGLVRLGLTRHKGKGTLKGYDGKGKEYNYPFTAEGICKGLKEKRLLPCLFTTFLEVAFARGITCFGGFRQFTYLPLMQQGLIKTLTECGYKKWAKTIALVPTANYAKAIIAIASYQNNSMQSAGAIELLARGGIGLQDVEKLSSLTVKEANLPFLIDRYQTLHTKQVNAKNKDRMAAILRNLSSKMITIQL